MNKTVFASLLLALPLSLSAAPQTLNVPLPAPSPAAPAALPASTAAPSAFVQLDAQQQRQRRADYAAWRALPEGERERIRQAAARFNALPADQQQRLRQQFQAQDQAFREGWRLGPQLGLEFPKLHGLFGFVPPEQRETALAVLRQLSPAQLAQLTLVAQRTPPQERDAVRSAFLAVPAAERDAWLKRQAGQ
ncbi:DUF3106 domain-containing protein [Stenotrophomonas maltophilia]|jgi:hypothetical protein|uniref:DUF3106 domain-containing protein n=1 Tax=Stenotrophomonas TaxID=40323 RepID=UPI00201CCAB1|nr:MULTISPECIES: DUF3106 domain-containing protein [Stenotrophomonas]MBN5026990.1 DUF3106 domain-containing protein [Stenotrophomonas maltophilia]MDH1272136.1 DUF3106 domain-containing protein [Stenotrophomonas sp. GD03937]MDH1486341.1 DUF3106 domain-containing protein [Stenotrophomonas sp. GD03712]MDR2960358.1 DUF3106 domain-containing protein [Stenotrophomonas sp.]UQY94987.1 DUF3106 domain-containing protein [Stenotrophomonas maltophilia]